METRCVTDGRGERLGVILDVRDYERLMEALEDLADLRATDETLQAIARGEEELLPFDEAVHEMVTIPSTAPCPSGGPKQPTARVAKDAL
jgi:hypothetical protein